MRTLVGVYDPRGADDMSAALARAAGTGPEQIVRIGPLTLAGAEPPARHGSVSCFFNGALHNAAEAAARLGLHADAEPAGVVARGFARYGVRFLETLRGSYLLVLWDDARRKAIITQDHLSARAVFYHDDGSRLTFASEIPPLLAALPRRPAPDPQIVPRWITDRALPDGLTLYTGVRRLTMGSSLYLSEHRHELRRIWEPRYVRPEPVDAAEAGGLIREAVKRAVERRLETGETGILLSGGFDSGTLAGFAARTLRERGAVLPAYSAVFPGEMWDESAGVETLTSELGLPSTRVRVSGGTLATAVNFERTWELPLPAPGAILDQPLLALAAEAGQRVMLDGQGGDELFSASPYVLGDYALRGRFATAWKLAHRLPGVGARLEPWQLRAIFRQCVVKGAMPHAVHGLAARVRGSRYGEIGWLTPASRRSAEALEDPWAWKGVRRGPRWWQLLSYLLVEARELAGSQDFLRRRAALFGIEARQPLMADVDLVELMLRLPPDLAFSPVYDRALAREAMRGVVPEPVRSGTAKSNYGEFIHSTLAKRDFDDLRRVLSPRDAEVGAFVDLELVRRDMLGRPPQAGDPGWAVWGQHVWALATTELWLRSNAMGTGFSAWVEGLRLSRCRVDLLAAPATPGGVAAVSPSPFFRLASDLTHTYSSESKTNVAGG